MSRSVQPVISWPWTLQCLESCTYLRASGRCILSRQGQGFYCQSRCRRHRQRIREEVCPLNISPCLVRSDICHRYGVTGFPTLKWFDGKGNYEPYESGRDLDSFTSLWVKLSWRVPIAYRFCSITGKTGVKSSIKPPPPPSYPILDYSNFDEVVMVSLYKG